MATYTLRDEAGVTLEIEADSLRDAREAAHEWVEGGDYDVSAEEARVRIRIEDEDGDEVDEIVHVIPVEEPECEEGEEHDLEPDPLNPDVRSLGGTTMSYVTYCLRCGRCRHAVEYGTQRNPGQGDRVEWDDADQDTIRRLRSHYGRHESPEAE